MKILRTLALSLLTSVAALAQFEGKIVWSMKADLDPAIAAKMNAAQQQMNSPEMQAKMAAARKQMESPEMKAMMEANPQMKAMMERQMAALAPKADAAPGAAGGGMFPTGMTVYLKGTDTLSVPQGGMMPREVLALGAKSEVYMIDRAGKSYSKMPMSVGTAPGGGKITYDVKKTGETQKILGYTATRYEITSQMGGKDGAQQIVLWASPDVKGLKPDQLSSMRFGDRADAGFLKQIDGIPLRMEVALPQAKMTMEVTSIDAGSQPGSLFVLPADFTEAAMPFGGKR